MWDSNSYKQWLQNRLIEIKNTLDFSDYKVEVYNEQDYAKERSIKPKTITVVAKFLTSTIIFSAKTQPIQIIVITEENGISVANSIMTKFCETYNFQVIVDGSTYIKNMYTTPSVLSNFNLIGIGMRTVLYISATLFVLDNVCDIKDLIIDSKAVEILNGTLGYTMSGDTQPFNDGFATTVKSYAVNVLTFNVPCVETDFVTKVLKIMNGSSTDKGNDNFAVAFNVGSLSFSLTMKLSGAVLTTAVNNVPALQVSLTM